MKTKILFIAFAFAFSFSAWSQQPDTLGSLPSAHLGYWVVYSTNGKKEKPIKTETLADVYSMAQMCFPGNCDNITSELQQSPWYAIEGYRKYFYVEVKRINRNGHYRRLSNRKFNQLKIKN